MFNQSCICKLNAAKNMCFVRGKSGWQWPVRKVNAKSGRVSASSAALKFGYMGRSLKKIAINSAFTVGISKKKCDSDCALFFLINCLGGALAAVYLQTIRI